jgi:hypothetical protein
LTDAIRLKKFSFRPDKVKLFCFSSDSLTFPLNFISSIINRHLAACESCPRMRTI